MRERKQKKTDSESQSQNQAGKRGGEIDEISNDKILF